MGPHGFKSEGQNEWCVWGLCHVELILNNFNLGAFLLGGELALHLDLFLWWLHWRCKLWQLSLPFWADWMVAWKLVMRTLRGLDQDVVVNYKIHVFCFMDWWQNVDGLKKESTLFCVYMIFKLYEAKNLYVKGHLTTPNFHWCSSLYQPSQVSHHMFITNLSSSQFWPQLHCQHCCHKSFLFIFPMPLKNRTKI